MRELERDFPNDDPARHLGAPGRVLALVGPGRLGTALAAALSKSSPARWQLAGPFGRGYIATGADAVLLCVPDGEIANAAGAIPAGPLVGHCSGATNLDALAPHEAFSLHPLLPVTQGQSSFEGAGAAVAGSTARALAFAHSLAEALGMDAIEIAEADRAAYHAAASVASNFLITLESAAERIAATAGVSRELMVPLVRATVANWAALGPERALTGPVARGDEATVAAQRRAIETRTPDLLPLFDELVGATRQLAARHPERELETAAA